MKAERGFTLIELVVVMMLVAVISVVAIPRLFNKSEFAARGAHDVVASAFGYAQKSAIAMRRNVCISVAGSALAATYATASGNDQACAAGNALTHPINGLPFADAANALPGGATVAASASVVFDASGRPLSAPSVPLTSAITITVNDYALPIIIEPETGLVH